MSRQYYRQLVVGLSLSVAAILIAMVFPDPFARINRSLLESEYHLRGESKVDSSIVILYLNNDDIAALGGLPLRRSYYALLLKALHELEVSAVGLDIGFTEPDREHPEYDQLLASTVGQSGNVILAGYFRSITGDEQSFNHRLPEKFLYNPSAEMNILKGKNLELPYPELLDSAFAFGHTNITDENEIPLFVTEGASAVPAFSLEVLRVSQGINKSMLSIEGEKVVLNGGHNYAIPVSPQGRVSLNYTGGLRSLNVVPVVSFLQAYDNMKTEGTSDLLLEKLKGKTVLVGIIAEGRSSFAATPFAQQFPSIALHAMVLDNAIKGIFLKKFSAINGYLFAFFIGAICTAFLFFRKEYLGIAGIVFVLIVIVVTSFTLFSRMSYVLPTAELLFAAVMVTAGVVIYRHQLVKEQVTTLSEEKDAVSALLQEKELRLRTLEQQRAHARTADGRSTELMEEIRKYKTEIQALKKQHEDLQPFAELAETPKGGRREFNGIVYSSDGPMADVVEFIKKIADSDATVLLLGESGTGKEVIARAIHQHSRRGSNAFIAVNCGALTETLLESELFGHEKGAFTGAVKERQGRFELADGGTIFLDEIAETSEAFQVKLLRVLQEGTFERVGGAETRKTHARVIAATNRVIRQSVEEKRFREDLYYRLNVFTIQLRPLRERPGDIPFLVEYFVTSEDPGMGISANVMKYLQEYQWKGNVRELQSVIKRAVLLAKSENRDMLRAKDLPQEVTASVSFSLDIEERIVESLRDKKFSRSAISETADDLGGLNRGTVAEYFRGYCFKIFLDNGYDVLLTIEAIMGESDPSGKEKVEKKLQEYLRNAVDLVDRSRSADDIQTASRAKYKNLPQRYHPALDQIITSYHAGHWHLMDDVA